MIINYKRPFWELGNDPKIISVFCQRYIWGNRDQPETSRFISRITLSNTCKKLKCDLYEDYCKKIIKKDESIECERAWKATIGKGKKEY